MVRRLNNFLRPGGTTDLTSSPVNEVNCITAEGLWYYNHFTELQNPPSIYKKLVSEASEKVWVWDPYFHVGDEVLFESVKKEVEIRMLSASYFNTTLPDKTVKFINAVSRVQEFSQFKLEVRIYNTKTDEEKNAFHDRYLFVDDDVYSVGSSIQYHRRRITSTAIHKVSHTSAKEVIESQFNHIWQHQKTQQVLVKIGGQL